MKRKGLQELVKSIISDEGVRSEFSQRPRGVIATYDLTAAEKKVVLSRRAKMILVSDGPDVEPFSSWF
jgi:hypothetical protein